MNRVKSYKILKQTKFLSLFSLNCVDGDQTFEWVLSSRNSEPKCFTGTLHKSDAVVIAAIHKETNKIVVTEEFRYPLDCYTYGLPAGLIDDRELIVTSAVRELFEETGLKITEVISVTPNLMNSSGMTDESATIVFVYCAGTLSDENLQDNEDISTLLLDQNEVKTLLEDKNALFDAKAYLILKTFSLTGKF